MRITDAWSLQLIGYDKFLGFAWNTSEEWRRSDRRLFATWETAQIDAPGQKRGWWEHWLPLHLKARQAPMNGDCFAVWLPEQPPTLARLILAPQCGCCGSVYRSELKLVADSEDPCERRWRCEKHLGRSPCIFEGCGRTFADPTNEVQFLCGKHFRAGPKRLRAHIRAIERKAKRFGWNERLGFLHNQAWRRLVRAIHEPARIDLAEIERLFGV